MELDDVSDPEELVADVCLEFVDDEYELELESATFCTFRGGSPNDKTNTTLTSQLLYIRWVTNGMGDHQCITRSYILDCAFRIRVCFGYLFNHDKLL